MITKRLFNPDQRDEFLKHCNKFTFREFVGLSIDTKGIKIPTRTKYNLPQGLKGKFQEIIITYNHSTYAHIVIKGLGTYSVPFDSIITTTNDDNSLELIKQIKFIPRRVQPLKEMKKINCPIRYSSHRIVVDRL